MSVPIEDLVRGERDGKVRAFWAFALIAVVWAWICVPKIIQTLLSPKYRLSVGVENAPYSRLAGIADYALYLGVIAVCVLIIIGYLTSMNTSALGRLAVMIAPWAYIVVRDLYVPTTISEEGIVYILIVLAIWLLRPRITQLQSLGYLMGLTALISVVIALTLPAQAIFRTAAGEVIVDDKQILPGGLLVGIFTQGNNLGQFLALGLPTIFLIRHRWHRLILVALALLAIVWSASRGAMIAVGVGLIAFVLVRACRPWWRKLMAPTVVLVPFVVVCVVPLITTRPDAFTNRGLVWTVSLQAWRSEPWLGLGSDWYQTIGRTSSRIAGSVFHGHNQFVQFMVTGGVIFGLLVLPQLFVATARATRLAVDGKLFSVTWLAILGGSCLLEKSFSFVDNGNFLIAMVVPFATIVLGSDLDQPPPDPATWPDEPASTATPPASTYEERVRKALSGRI
jgi:O-antigen ligase